jgi:hypothetical protein
MRTINRNLRSKADKNSRAALIAALCSRRTELGARDSVEAAIKYVASSEKARYIRSNWLANLRMWAKIVFSGIGVVSLIGVFINASSLLFLGVSGGWDIVATCSLTERSLQVVCSS